MKRLAVLGVVCGVALAVWPGAALAAAPGELDSSYGTGGVFAAGFQTEPSGAPPRYQSAAVDSQRRTVIAATHVDAQNRRHLDVMRLTAQGTLDTTFNANGPTPGILEVDFSSYVGPIDVYARGVAVVGGDKVVALGWVHDTNGSDFTALMRVGSDGSYDTTFGANQDGRTVDLANPDYARNPDSLAVDNLGRILVGGFCGQGCGAFVARYTNTGARDSAGFNANDGFHPGVVVLAQGGDVSSLALATDGSNDILAAAGSSSSDEAVIARLHPDGTLDATFGASGPTPGVVENGMGCQGCPNSGGAFAFGVAPGPSGAVYATGQVSDASGTPMRLLRLTQPGNPDPGFGMGSPAPGVVALPAAGSRGVAVAVDGSACPVIAGYGLGQNNNAQIVAARLTPAGQLDQAFNPSGQTPGVATFQLGVTRALGETVALQDDGKIVLGGEADQFGNTTTRHAVALRLLGGGCGTASQRSPSVVTGQANAISYNAATLNGTVNPNGDKVTDCHFDYGITTNYGSSVPCSQSPGAGSTPVAVSAPISGLDPNTTYDYRLVAGNAGGTNNGDNQTFSTARAPTTTASFQRWGSTSGESISVSGGATGEDDAVEVNGPDTSHPSGTVTFRLFSDPACTRLVFGPDTKTVDSIAGGTSFATSDPVTNVLARGTYYWTVAYSGDAANQPSTSPCGSEKLTVAPFRIFGNRAFISARSFALTIGCTLLPCRLRVTITLPTALRASLARQTAKSKSPVITLARGKLTIRTRGAHTLRLPLTAAGRRFVASHRGHVTVNVALATTARGHTTVVKERLTIKIARR